MSTGHRSRWVGRLIVDAFIAIHVLAIVAWSLPEQRVPAVWRVRRAIAPYMNRSGLWQDWQMFAPHPLTSNYDVLAELTYHDGTSATWIFPRMETLGYAERYQKERYRKWRERVRDERFRIIWPDTARYVAHLQPRAGEAVIVTLTSFWSDIPAPTDEVLPAPSLLRYRRELFSIEIPPRGQR